MKKQKEIWKDIVGFEGQYKISNLGNVYSIKSGITMKQSVDRCGYAYILLCSVKYKHYKTVKIHRAVYQAFRGPIPKGFDIDHLNEDKLCNNIRNLSALPHEQHVRRHKLGHEVSEQTRKKLSEIKKRYWTEIKKKVNAFEAIKKYYVLKQIDEYNYRIEERI